MQRIKRTAAVVPAVVLALAACASPDAGGGPTQTQPGSAIVTGSPAASPTAQEAPRIDIGAFTTDPSAFTEGPIRILGRVDAVVSEDQAFYTSPSASEEGRVLVVLAEDAEVAKEIAEGSVLWISGIAVEATESDLASAGAVTTETGDYEGEYALVANRIDDPLTD